MRYPSALALALLFALVAGCAKNDKGGPKFQPPGFPGSPEDERLKTALDAISKEIDKQEAALRRAEGANLDVEKRLELAETWLAESEPIQKQIDDVLATAQTVVRTGVLSQPRQEQLKTVTERWDRLAQGWQAVFDRVHAELHKPGKPEPPKK